jgi:hypothetical protein
VPVGDRLAYGKLDSCSGIFCALGEALKGLENRLCEFLPKADSAVNDRERERLAWQIYGFDLDFRRLAGLAVF